MSIKNDIQVSKEYLLMGFPITHSDETNSLNYYLRMNQFNKPFIKCYMYSELKNKADINSAHTIVEFNQGVELDDVIGNSFLVRELLLYYDIRYLAFFNGSKEFVVNAIASSDCKALDEMICQKGYAITDVPIDHQVKIYDLQDLQEYCM